MAILAGQPASAADVLALLQMGSKVTFTTTTPAGSGWHRTLQGGEFTEFYFQSTSNVSATTTVTLDYTMPVGNRPTDKTTITAAASTTTRLAAAVVDSAGAVTVYNGHSSSAVVYIHGIYPNA